MWSDETRPTLPQVQEIIDMAVEQMTSAVGADVPLACQRGARGTCALLAAMLIELSYWPEQARSDRSAYHEYKDLYDKQIALVQECVQSNGAGTEAGGGGSMLHNVPAIPQRLQMVYRAPAARRGASPSGGPPTTGPNLRTANWREPLSRRAPPLPEDARRDMPAGVELK